VDAEQISRWAEALRRAGYRSTAVLGSGMFEDACVRMLRRSQVLDALDV
jgi:hypothetical protein